MVFEIERRALLTDKAEFEKVKAYLDENAKYLGKRTFTSYLFREPNFLRIRIEGEKVTITEKEGDYEDIGRQEKNREIILPNLKNELVSLKNKGFKKCSKVKTKRYSYEFNVTHVELNEIDFLGMIVEVEALTKNKEEIKELDKKVKETLEKLGLKELSFKKYKNMMKKIYDNSNKNILEICK